MFKELQTKTVTKKIIHADFYEIRMDKKLTLDVPIHILGSAIGVEKGGELKQFKRDVKISALPGLMPRHIDVDVTDLMIDSTVHVRDLKLNEGVETVDAGNASIVTVSAKRAVVGEEAAPAAAGGKRRPRSPRSSARKVRRKRSNALPSSAVNTKPHPLRSDGVFHMRQERGARHEERDNSKKGGFPLS